MTAREESSSSTHKRHVRWPHTMNPSPLPLSSSMQKMPTSSRDDQVLWATATVTLPSNDFELEMWGEAGIPEASPQLLKSNNSEKHTDAATDAEEKKQPEQELEDSFENRHAITANHGVDSTEEEEEKIRLTNFCWKRRSGMGKFSVSHPWERRRLVLVGSKVYYFRLTPEEKEAFAMKQDLSLSQEQDETTASTAETSSEVPPEWLEQAVAQAEHEAAFHNPTTSSTTATPRGVIDLSQEGAFVEASEDNTGSTGACPTPYEIDVKIPGDVHWKLCFESQSVQIEWLAALADVISSAAGPGGKEHNFEAGDHVIRWEMLPIVYPIQIHGIVLEAGRNCVIIADFGLTSYGKAGTSTSNEETKEKEESHDFVMQTWNKMKPTHQKQRLNVIALTDPKEIRKWSKINYGRNLFSKKGNKLTSLFRKSSKTVSTPHAFSEADAKRELQEAMEYINTYNETKSEDGDEDDNGSVQNANVDDSEAKMEESKSASPYKAWKGDRASVESFKLRDPEWFHQDNGESSLQDEEWDHELARPPVFALEYNDLPTADESSKLPKSDPVKIVLARANFLLEFGEEILPPYHVFHSNSECIAVFCKTGRWNTLQTAVFLHSTAIGNAKSATAITLSVAAAHVVLVPALAVGGLAMVTAPWLLLKKSKEKWDEATMKLTDLFWAWAEPEVFVAAIENWSNVGSPAAISG